ncbi:MAG: isochorismate synthase [Kofleriaceae bacterium]
MNSALEEAAATRPGERARWLDAALERAGRAAGWTSVVLPASVADPSALCEVRGGGLAAWWPPHGEAVVGVGAAAILRATGADRWSELRAQAEQVAARVEQRVFAGELVAGDPHHGPTRPRFLGGVAFAAGAAAAPPWRDFGDAWFLLPRWTYVSDGTTATLTLLIDREGARERARLRAEWVALEKALAAPRPPRPRARVTEIEEDGERWVARVADARTFIQAGAAAKVVAARCQHLRLAETVRPGDVYGALAERHPDCYRVLVAPQRATWLAATPERLVRRSGLTVSCDALAGSIPSRGEHELEAARLLASGKERGEHELVVTAIVDTLRGAGARVAHAAEPVVRSLRHVHHLATAVEGQLEAPLHVLAIAERLHPTPAVGGTPTATALDWIRDHEGEPRGWYAAPVGWFDRAGDGEFAVGIRSGLLEADRAHLWAGAGIVAESEPTRELAETTVKLRALRGALGLDE